MNTIKIWRLLVLPAVVSGVSFQLHAWWPSMSLFATSQAENDVCLSPIVADELVHDAAGFRESPFGDIGDPGLLVQGNECKDSLDGLEIADEPIAIDMENPVDNPIWTFAEDGQEYDPTFGISAGVTTTSFASFIQREESDNEVLIDSGISALWGVGALQFASSMREKVGRLFQATCSAAHYARQGTAACKKLCRVAKCLDRASDVVLSLEKRIAEYQGKLEVYKRYARTVGVVGLSWLSYIALKKLERVLSSGAVA